MTFISVLFIESYFGNTVSLPLLSCNFLMAYVNFSTIIQEQKFNCDTIPASTLKSKQFTYQLIHIAIISIDNSYYVDCCNQHITYVDLSVSAIS